MPPLPAPRDAEGSNGGGFPAGYGRSCTNCSRAKCRCIVRLDGGKCERCTRLGKDCQPMVASRRRVAKKTAPSRSSQLEERLQDLLVLLRDSQSLGAAAASSSSSSSSSSDPATAAAAAAAGAGHGGASRDGSSSPVLARGTPRRGGGGGGGGGSNAGQVPDRPTPRHAPSLSASSLFETSLGAGRGAAAAAAAPPPPPPTTDPLFAGPSTPPHSAPRSGNASEHADLDDLDGIHLPTPAEADACIDRFRLWLENWPFMRLDLDVSSEALRRERPALWLSIVNLCTRSLRLQARLRDRVRAEFAQRIVVGCERSLDLVQACIAHVGWAMFHAGLSGKPFLGMMLQITSGMVLEMGLSTHPSEEYFTTIVHQVWSKRSALHARTRSMDERRAVLSLWFLSSVYSTFVGRNDTMTFTPSMHNCLNVLARERDSPHDETLVALVRLQLLGEEAKLMTTRNTLSLGPLGEPTTPVLEAKKRLLSDLEALRANSPSRYVVHSHSLAVEAKILTIGVFGERLLPDAPRADAMYALLLAVKAWHEAFFKTPPSVLCTLALHHHVALTYMQHLLYVMTLGDDVAGAANPPGWDRAAVRDVADLLAYTDRCVDLLEQMDRAHAFRRDVDDFGFFVAFARMMRVIRSVWEPLLRRAPGAAGGDDTPARGDPALLAHRQSPGQQQQQQQQQHVEMMPAMDQILGLSSMEDLTWISSFMDN